MNASPGGPATAARPASPGQADGPGLRDRSRLRSRDAWTGRPAVLVAGTVLSVLVTAWCVSAGTTDAGPLDVWRAIRLRLFGGVLTEDFAATYNIIINLRLPR